MPTGEGLERGGHLFCLRCFFFLVNHWTSLSKVLPRKEWGELSGCQEVKPMTNDSFIDIWALTVIHCAHFKTKLHTSACPVSTPTKPVSSRGHDPSKLFQVLRLRYRTIAKATWTLPHSFYSKTATGMYVGSTLLQLNTQHQGWKHELFN